MYCTCRKEPTISELQDLANLDLVLTLSTHRTILSSQLRMDRLVLTYVILINQSNKFYWLFKQYSFT